MDHTSSTPWSVLAGSCLVLVFPLLYRVLRAEGTPLVRVVKSGNFYRMYGTARERYLIKSGDFYRMYSTARERYLNTAQAIPILPLTVTRGQ